MKELFFDENFNVDEVTSKISIIGHYWPKLDCL